MESDNGATRLSALEREIAALMKALFEMGGAVETIVENAASMFQLDAVDSAFKLAPAEEIEVLQREINEKSAKILATRSPVAADLNDILSIMSVSTQLNACVTYVYASISQVQAISDRSKQEPALKAIHRILMISARMLADALDAFAERNEELADDVCARHQIVLDAYDALYREMITRMLEDPRIISTAKHAEMSAKDIERMAFHATLIAKHAKNLDNNSFHYQISDQLGQREPAGNSNSNTVFCDIPRDKFDVLRDLEALLGELVQSIGAINDPDRISNDLLYVRAAAESLRTFIDAYENKSKKEIPAELPKSLLERLLSIDVSKLDKLAGLVQKIVDLMSRIF